MGLSKAGFGELIGGAKIENKVYLHYFIRFFVKKHLSGERTPFVTALRAFLQYFKIPGEG